MRWPPVVAPLPSLSHCSILFTCLNVQIILSMPVIYLCNRPFKISHVCVSPDGCGRSGVYGLPGENMKLSTCDPRTRSVGGSHRLRAKINQDASRPNPRKCIYGGKTLYKSTSNVTRDYVIYDLRAEKERPHGSKQEHIEWGNRSMKRLDQRRNYSYSDIVTILECMGPHIEGTPNIYKYLHHNIWMLILPVEAERVRLLKLCCVLFLLFLIRSRSDRDRGNVDLGTPDMGARGAWARGDRPPRTDEDTYGMTPCRNLVLRSSILRKSQSNGMTIGGIKWRADMVGFDKTKEAGRSLGLLPPPGLGGEVLTGWWESGMQKHELAARSLFFFFLFLSAGSALGVRTELAAGYAVFYTNKPP